jgi:hypothetical protein
MSCSSALVAQEMDWLDKLEKRLRKSPKSAADAEEISEELDVSLKLSTRQPILSLFCIHIISSPSCVINEQDHCVGTEFESCVLVLTDGNHQSGSIASS